MQRFRPFVGLVAVLVAGSTLAACGSSGGGGSNGGGGAETITLYSGQHEQTTAALVKAFTAESGIKVKVRSDDEASLANQLIQEGSDTPADVFFAENPPALNILDEDHLLAKTDTATLAKVDAKYSPTSGDCSARRRRTWPYSPRRRRSGT